MPGKENCFFILFGGGGEGGRGVSLSFSYCVFCAPFGIFKLLLGYGLVLCLKCHFEQYFLYMMAVTFLRL